MTLNWLENAKESQAQTPGSAEEGAWGLDSWVCGRRGLELRKKDWVGGSPKEEEAGCPNSRRLREEGLGAWTLGSDGGGLKVLGLQEEGLRS